ncbi:histidine kinase [Paucibacter sp. R3-3]|uniref:histidine kinase n=1 Tax=Roseateles agri TaxID=3098619 RepID=A0ABU5DH64_9BURK|nr:histidine kinase [Paucibacter sp. R3-3]MDY0745083.1 histidine kinase [Paucibacter sp. R3-3]
MTPAAPSTPPSLTAYQRWQRFSSTAVRWFHIYANWLVGISWKRFIVYAIVLLIGTNIIQELPPFTWRVSEHVDAEDLPVVKPAKPAKPAKAAKAAKPVISLDKPIHYEVTIDERGVRIHPTNAASAASAASSAASSASDASSSDSNSDLPSVNIDFGKEGKTEDIKRAVEQARQALEDAAQDARDAAREAADEQKAADEATAEAQRMPRTRTTIYRLGDFLVNLAVFWILASALLKATYKGRIVAEQKAAVAAETAEAESLKRQVVEARMAAMQAQVEPHFLFNTLASIDHLIETDPPRASQMQKNLIALLRASMPTMREANATGVRDLGRELAVIKPYLEILKVRMEERLQTEIDVPEGLLSAEFPPMMIQGLVENAIKHGLEPKAEGGSLRVKAEIVHGKLAVTVADTGLGFGRAATSGTGVGLANIRERLMLLYGPRAAVTVTENQPSGTKVTITVPYVSRAGDDHPSANNEGAKA